MRASIWFSWICFFGGNAQNDMNEPASQPAPPPPRPPFQFTLRTLLLLFVVLASSLGVFGAWGIVVFILVVGLAIYVHHVESSLSLVYCAWTVITLLGFAALLVGGFKEQAIGDPVRHLNWPNIAALAVWLLSVGTLLTCAVRGRQRSRFRRHLPAEVETPQ